MLDAVAQRSFDEILARVEDEIGSTTFGFWFRGCVFSGLDRGTLRIGVRTLLICEWIQRNYLKTLSRLAEEVFGIPVTISIEVDERLARQHRDEIARVDAEFAATPERKAKSRNETLRGDLFDFVVTSENEFAYRIVAQAAQGGNPGHNPLVIVGAAGCGKTHLMGAFRRPAKAGPSQPRALFTSAGELTAHFTMAVKTKKVAAFRAYYDDYGVVVIDDVHELSGKKATQAELVALIKGWQESGPRVVVASRHHPRAVSDLAPALRSLLLGGMVVQMNPYSKRSLARITGNAVGPDRKAVASEVVAAMAEGCHGSVAELQARLVRVCGYASLRDEKPDLDFVRRHFGELAAPREGADGRELVLDRVCSYFDLRREDLLSKRKTRSLLLPRGLVACVLRDRLKLTLKEIGAILGGRSHTSIHLLIRRYGPQIAEQAEYLRLREELETLADGAPGSESPLA